MRTPMIRPMGMIQSHAQQTEHGLFHEGSNLHLRPLTLMLMADGSSNSSRRSAYFSSRYSTYEHVGREPRDVRVLEMVCCGESTWLPLRSRHGVSAQGSRSSTSGGSSSTSVVARSCSASGPRSTLAAWLTRGMWSRLERLSERVRASRERAAARAKEAEMAMKEGLEALCATLRNDTCILRP